MSKTKYLLIWVLLLLPNIVSAWWYTIDKTSDFYSDIYDKQDELKAKYQKVTLLSWDTKANLSTLLNNWITYNNKSLPACFTKEMTIDDFNTIISGKPGQMDILKNYLSQDCLTLKTEFQYYVDLIQKYNVEKTKQADNTIKQINSIWKIWLYSDWDTLNSPFDIIQDMKEIDKIIFERGEYLPYNWVNIDFEKWLELLASWIKTSDIAQKLKNTPTEEESLNNAVSQVQSININNSWALNLNNQLCVDNTQSWLDWNIIDMILNTTNSSSGTVITNSWNTNVSSWDSSSWSGVVWDWYKKTTDNSIWPCNEYFCITFEAQKATQELFWGFTMKFPAIDTLFKKSNTHLEKAANTSLAQSKMTTNNFELSLKNIDLWSMFNAWLFVSNKPNPNLLVSDSTKVVNGEFSAIKMLEESYKAYWMDYKYQNNLDILDDVEMNKYITETSKELNTRVLVEKKAWYDYKKEQNTIKLIALDKSVDNEMQKQDMKVLSTDLTEVEWYVEYLMEYAYQLYSIVKSMDKIPSN